MKKKKGFTLVELLAVIVILAIILVIAVPQIISTITESRKGALISSAKLIAASAESAYMSNQTLGIEKTITCSDVSKLNSEDYDSCTITFDSNGKAKVTIVGKGKFEGMSVCSATRETGEVSSECATDVACFAYEEVEGGVSITGYNLVLDFTINEETCMEYFGSWYIGERLSTYCTGGTYQGDSLKNDINKGWESVETLETEGVIRDVTYVNGNVCQSDSVIVPNEIDNKIVTAIGDSVFAGNQLTSVTIPDSVTSIGNSAFLNNQLTGVIIPSSVTTIGDYAFSNNQLTSVTIPSSVTTIGIAAFNNNKLKGDEAFIYKRNSDGTIDNTHVVSYGGITKNVTIPDSVTTIGIEAFSMNALTSVTIPDSVTTIGGLAFYNNQITEVNFPTTPLTLGCGVFDDNPIVDTLEYPSNVTITCSIS